MRKLLSVLLAAVMLLAVAVPAFADGGDSGSPVVTPEIADGDAGVSSKTPNITATEKTGSQAEQTVKDAFESDIGQTLNPADYKEAVALDVSWVDGSDGQATVVITYTGEGQIAKVLYEHQGTWYAADFEYIGNNQYRIYFTQGLCPVVLLTKAGKPAEPTTNTGSSAPKSPKTGYD